MFKILNGDSADSLKQLADNSIDSVVTDPPYGLSFMGKKWDYDVPSVELWREVLRVLKPGGHLLSFGGTRTYHRMVVAIENAGFEIRDQLQWLYGSGFPKSMDISKAIDKAAGAEREVIGYSQGRSAPIHGGGQSVGTPDAITAPATPEAKRWQGWGTALKPANEPVVCAQKRFEPVPLSDILTEHFLLLEAFLWSMLDAKSADQILGLSQVGSREALGSVRGLAGLFHILRLEDQSELMVTSNSQAAVSTFLNIVSLWKDIWGEVLSHGSTYTTSTKTSLITELKTLNSSLLEIMPAGTILGLIHGNGLWLNARSAEKASQDSDSGQKNIEINFAHETAGLDIMKTLEGALANIAESVLKLPLVMGENSARRSVQTSITTEEERNLLNIYANNANLNLRQFLVESPNTVLGSVWQSPTESLRPLNEPVVLARKPLEKGLTVAANVLKWGVGGLNIDGCRVEAIGDSLKQLIANTGRGGFQKEGGYVGGSLPPNHSDYGKGTMSTQGRWPANVIFDEEAAAMLDEQSGVLKSGAMNGVYRNTIMKNQPGVRDGKEIHLRQEASSGGASRFFYCAKASKSERNKGLEGVVKEKQGNRPNSKDMSGKFPDHDHRPTGGNNHPTVKPVQLMRYLVRLVTPPCGTVLDPFMGSGTTGVACKSEGFKFIGIELNPEYVEIAEKRIEAATFSSESFTSKKSQKRAND